MCVCVCVLEREGGEEQLSCGNFLGLIIWVAIFLHSCGNFPGGGYLTYFGLWKFVFLECFGLRGLEQIRKSGRFWGVLSSDVLTRRVFVLGKNILGFCLVGIFLNLLYWEVRGVCTPYFRYIPHFISKTTLMRKYRNVLL